MPSAPDIRALGRLGETLGASTPRTGKRRGLARRRGDGRLWAAGRSSVGGASYVGRRARIPRAVVLGTGLALLALIWLGAAANGQTGPNDQLANLAQQPAVTGPATTPERPASDTSRGQTGDGAEAFAMVDGLALSLPHPSPVLVGYHEATQAEALPLTPVGRMLGNDNPTKFEEQQAAADGPEYLILSSRGRARPATSAVDIAVPEGGSVAAPVTGTVTEVRQYDLTGTVRDWRVVITPEERPDLHVVLIHLHQPAVDVGEQVTAGQTQLARVRQLPFDSHIDYATGERQPHTHLEVSPAVDAAPFDPNAPALPPGES